MIGSMSRIETFLQLDTGKPRDCSAPLEINACLVWLPVALLIALGEAVHFSDSNLPLFLELNVWGARLPDAFWASTTHTGDILAAATLLIPLARRYPQIIWAVLVAAPFAVAYVYGVKPWFDIPRPPAVLASDTFNLIGTARYDRAFPSGHSATAFTVAGVCILYVRAAWLRTVLFVLATLIAISRVMVGAHWPLDVIFGALGGWGAACLGAYLGSRWPAGLRPWPRRVQLVILLAAALALIGHDGGYAAAAWLSWLIGVPGTLLASYFLYRSFRPRGTQKVEPGATPSQ
jgi:membrane-associated phospholipid phosphatase